MLPDDETRTHVTLTSGTMISHYRIIEQIGAGGMGEVYLAEDTELNRKVALKFLPPQLSQDAECRARFKREAQAAAKLNHANIVTIHEVGECDGRPFIAMEHLQGTSLIEFAKFNRLSWQSLSDVAIQIAEAMGEAHRSGVIHRDIKPSNILVDSKGKVKILDFGLAAIQGDKKLTKTGYTLGTLEYMSPEQTRGESLDARSDIFSFGVVLYEMITGQIPFRGEHEPAILYSIAYGEPEPLARYKSGVPEECQRIVSKALAKDKTGRYQHADEIAVDLRRLSSHPGIPAAPPRRNRWLLVTLALALGTVMLLLILKPWHLVTQPTREPNAATTRVAVLPFQNQTGDSALNALGRMVADWTSQSLLETGLAEVVPTEALSGPDADQGVSSIANATGAGMIVTGSYYRLGDSIQFQSQVLNGSAQLLQGVEPINCQTAKLMDAVGTVRQHLLGALAMLLDKRLQGTSTRGVKPPEYPAYLEFMLGIECTQGVPLNWAGAEEHFRQAYLLDTSFLEALLMASRADWNLGEFVRQDSLLKFLNVRRARLNNFQQMFLDFQSAQLSGNFLNALLVAREAARLAPGSMYSYFRGSCALNANRPHEALEALKEIDPEGPVAQSWLPYWTHLADAYHVLGENEKQLEVVRQGYKRFPGDFDLINSEVAALAAMGNIGEVKRLIEESNTLYRPRSSTTYSMFTVAALEFVTHGYTAHATEMFDQALEWYANRPADEMKAMRIWHAMMLYNARRWEEAGSIMRELSKEIPDNVFVKSYPGAIAARLGDRATAEKVSAQLGSMSEPYLFGEHTYQRACIAAILGDKDRAVVLLKEAIQQGKPVAGYAAVMHIDIDLESLRDYPPFQELMKPKG